MHDVPEYGKTVLRDMENIGISIVSKKNILLFTISTVWVSINTKRMIFLLTQTHPWKNIIAIRFMEEYHRDTVHGFYKFLLSQDVVIGTSTLKCMSSFLNAHIKAEFLACLKQARSQNVCIPNMTVGADPVIQQLVRFANKKRAATIRELQLDIQSSIDSRISEEESRSMLLMAAGISMPNCGKVITKDRLSRLVFACTYTVYAATMRRGDC
jgi:hypothetical protein